MDWSTFLTMIPFIATIVAIITSILIIYATKKINEIKTQQANLDREISEKNLEIIKIEFENKINLLEETKKITGEISQRISQQLIDDPTWLDRFMDQTGATYSASVYGNRIGHFYYEKKEIAENAILELENYLKADKITKYCLLIDSGTTMYPVFQEITKKIHGKNKDLWKNRICVVTNNIPGIQYLMKNGKKDPKDNYSEILIDCFLIPGKPLSVYAAITGNESIKWLKNFPLFLKEWARNEVPAKTVCFLTGNYMTRGLHNGKKYYYPAARGEGHVEIKNEMVNICDFIFLLSPLTKFSFAHVSLLNRVNDFTIKREDIANALNNPRKVEYEEIIIPEDKAIKFFVTNRIKGNMFNRFGESLFLELIQSYGRENIFMPKIDIKRWIPNVQEKPHLELDREIPHETLRKTWKPDENIWELKWVLSQNGSV
jgi:hypothetical protein